jgi:hypothetical protein
LHHHRSFSKSSNHGSECSGNKLVIDGGMGKPVPSLLMLLLSRGRVPLDCPTRWQDGQPSHSSNHILQRTYKIMPQARLSVRAKAKTLPFARCLRQSRRTKGGKATDSFHPLSNMLQDEGLRRGRPVSRPRPTRKPTWNSAHCNRPRTAECITGPICKGFSIMTVCNPTLWEYSGDDLGA